MGEIKLQFVRSKGFGSFAISWFSSGLYSHVDSVLPSWHAQPGWLLGARSDWNLSIPPGVRIRPPGYHDFSHLLVVTIPCTDQQERDYYGYLDTQIGTAYDRRAILAFALDRNW